MVQIIAPILQVHLCQHGGVAVIWTIHRQAAAERRRDINLAVIERGPIMARTIPRLPDSLQIIVGVVNKGYGAGEGVRDCLQVTVRTVVGGGNVIPIPIFDLCATKLVVYAGRRKRELSAVSRTNKRSIRVSRV